MTQHQLLENLSWDLDKIIESVQLQCADLTQAQLNWKENPNRWSILECLEHLNRYSRYYNTAIQKSILRAPARSSDIATSTWLGKKFIDMMRPQNVKKQKTLGHLNPLNSALDKNTIVEFMEHQHMLKKLIQQASSIDLNKSKVPVEFLKLLKMNTGDALQFIVVHEQRHMVQLQNIVSSMPKRNEPALKV